MIKTELLKRCASCTRRGEVVQTLSSFNIEWPADESRPASVDRAVRISEVLDPNYRCGFCEDPPAPAPAPTRKRRRR